MPGISGATRTWKWLCDWYPSSFAMRDIIPQTVEHSEMCFRIGDDPRWSAPDCDDSGWRVAKNREIPFGASVFWVRLRVRSTDAAGRIPSTLFIIARGPYEVFWDGVLVLRSGTPHHDPGHEVSGNYLNTLELSEALTGAGEHAVAVRMSTLNDNCPYPDGLFIFYTVPSDAYRRFDSNARLLPALAVGAVFSVGLVALMMWLFAARRLTLLLFAGLCALIALIVSAAAARFLFPFPANWSYPLWILQTIAVGAGAACLLALVLVQFKFPWKGWALFGLLAADAFAVIDRFPYLQTVAEQDFWRIAFAATIACGLWAAWRRIPAAWSVVLGVLLTAGLREVVTEHFMRTYFLPVFLSTLFGLLYPIAVSVRDERRQARDARLTAARLEIELLKQNLQPHFLLNTLMTLAQAIEESPALAIRLIDDLAEEFRALSRLAGEKRISLEQELKLCRAHLRVMSVRTEVSLSLETTGIDPLASVPPAIFLTLIENAFAHQSLDRGPVVFQLHSLNLAAARQYRFFSPGVVRNHPGREGGGTGLRYIRARLEEFWPGRWTLQQSAVSGGWETVIALGTAGAKGTLL